MKASLRLLRRQRTGDCRDAVDRQKSKLIGPVPEAIDRTNAVLTGPAGLNGGSASTHSDTIPQRSGPHELDRLHAALNGVTTACHPRTAKLLGSGTRKSAQKVIEEAGEVALEAVKHNASGVVNESADLLYHVVVLWFRAGIDPADVWREMRRRADAYGIAEKLPKTGARMSRVPAAEP
jgi:phosphoribosyl-ATP pyrophosphohydrolase